MLIPNDMIRVDARLSFIKRMYELDLPFYIGTPESRFARIRFKKTWLTFIEPTLKAHCGMLPELAKLISGNVVANRVAARYFNQTNKYKNEFCEYKNHWYNEQRSPVIRSVNSVTGVNLPPYYIRQHINPWCHLITNNIDFKVSGYNFIRQPNGDALVYKQVNLKQKWESDYDARNIFSFIREMIEISQTPIVLKSSERDDYLESEGWEVVGVSWSKMPLYMPKSMAYNAKI